MAEKSQHITSPTMGENATDHAPVTQAANVAENPKSRLESEERIRRKLRNLPTASTGPLSWSSKTDDHWLQEKIHWTDKLWGQMAIEFVSRLTLGGIFYSWMSNSSALAAVDRYNPEDYQKSVNGKMRTDWGKVFGHKNLLLHFSYLIDRTLGVGTKKAHYAIFRDSKRADKFVKFRENRLSAPEQAGGRSLGAEMVKVTADFAAMSAGTAIMRNTLRGVLNPDERRAWTNNGKFDPLHILKRLGKKAWEITTYNSGEDAGVAFGYVFFLRFWRNLIDKFHTPGFRLDSDHSENGGSVIVNSQGSPMGTMQIAGMIDIQGRFTFYNILTQFYRDGYNRLGRNLTQWKENNFKLTTPEFIKDPTSIPGRLGRSALGFIRYLSVSSITSIIQMTPSVPFFWAIRVPAAKAKGRAIHPTKGVMGTMVDGKFVAFTADGALRDPTDKNYHYDFQKGKSLKEHPNYFKKADGSKPERVVFKPKAQADGQDGEFNSPHPFVNTKDPTGKNPHGIPRDAYGRSLKQDKDTPRRFYYNFVERITDNIGRNVHKIAGHKAWLTMSKPFWKLVGIDESKHEQMAKDAALAAMPYASYFTAKVFWRGSVNDQMRLAVGRMLDGFVGFKLSEVREGAAEIGKTLQGLPLSNPDRQALLIQKRFDNPTDKSPMPSNWTRELHSKYLDHVIENGRMDTSDLAYITAERRSQYYKEKAKNIRAVYKQQISQETADEFIHVDPGYDRLDTDEDLREAILKKYNLDNKDQFEHKTISLLNSKPDSWQERKSQEVSDTSLAPAA